MKKQFVIFAVILFVIFLLRLPSLYEPFWYGDEGIFAAVGRNLNHGGVLYQTAWDNKPPMIYLTYAAIFKFFGVSMFWLRLATVIVVLSTATVIYEIAQATLGIKRALVATFIFGFLTSLRLVEGNLALTEIFMILPICLAMLVAIKRLPAGRQGNFDLVSLFGAGFLFAIASLYKQVGALEAAALGVFLFLISKNFAEFFKKGLVLTIGFVIPYAATVSYFASKNLVSDYIFAAYTYYRIYLGESPKYALLINVLKFLPIIAAIFYGFYKTTGAHPRGAQSHSLTHPGGEVKSLRLDVFHLFLLWTAFSFLGSYFSGRTYGHYLIQAIVPVSLLAASVNIPQGLRKIQIVFALFFFVPLIFLTKLLFTDFLSGGPINQITYFQNFVAFASGRKSLDTYNDYFDQNVNSVMGLTDFLRLKGAFGKSIYIWGNYPWLYAITDAKNPSRYVTSFHVFGVPSGQNEVATNLQNNPPDYIIKPPSSIGYFPELEKLITTNYTLVAKIENSQVFVRQGQ